MEDEQQGNEQGVEYYSKIELLLKYAGIGLERVGVRVPWGSECMGCNTPGSLLPWLPGQSFALVACVQGMLFDVQVCS